MFNMMRRSRGSRGVSRGCKLQLVQALIPNIQRKIRRQHSTKGTVKEFMAVFFFLTTTTYHRKTYFQMNIHAKCQRDLIARIAEPRGTTVTNGGWCLWNPKTAKPTAMCSPVRKIFPKTLFILTTNYYKTSMTIITDLFMILLRSVKSAFRSYGGARYVFMKIEIFLSRNRF